MVAAIGSISPTTEVNPRTTGSAAKAPEAHTNFEKLELKQPAATFQHLKPAGSLFGDLIGVPKYLVSRAIEKIGDMYTDYRLTQAAKQMATFNRETIDQATSANDILATWNQMADKNPIHKAAMEELGGPIAKIIKNAQSDKIDPIREKIESALSDIKNISSIETFSSPGAAAALRALSLEDKKTFLGAYDTLRTSLTSLQTIALSTREKAAAFYHTASECFERHDTFYTQTAQTLHARARVTYKQEAAAIHKQYVTDLTNLASTPDASAEAIADTGTQTLQKLEELQERVVALSGARMTADDITTKLDTTLGYLRNGVDSKQSLETDSTKKFVTLSDKSADAIAAYVEARVKTEREALREALKSGDLTDIEKATKALQEKSDEVHTNLHSVAKILNKVNAGYDAEKKVSTPDQAETILTLLRDKKMSEADVNAIEAQVRGFVTDLRQKLEERITKIFAVDEQGELKVTPTEQKEISLLEAYADDLLEQVKGMNTPTKDVLEREIRVKRSALEKALSRRDPEDEKHEAELAARIKEKTEPRPKPWWKFW